MTLLKKESTEGIEEGQVTAIDNSHLDSKQIVQ